MLYNKVKIVLLYWLPVFLWCVLIYYLSSLPSLRSDFSDSWDVILRKSAHITEFAILTFLLYRASALHFSRKNSIVFVALFAFIFSLTDEYHQTFVDGRSGNFRDVMIDAVGISLALCFIKSKASSGKRSD